MWKDILAFKIDDNSKTYKTNKITNITTINIFKIFRNKEEFICESIGQSNSYLGFTLLNVFTKI